MPSCDPTHLLLVCLDLWKLNYQIIIYPVNMIHMGSNTSIPPSHQGPFYGKDGPEKYAQVCASSTWCCTFVCVWISKRVLAYLKFPPLFWMYHPMVLLIPSVYLLNSAPKYSGMSTSVVWYVWMREIWFFYNVIWCLFSLIVYVSWHNNG